LNGLSLGSIYALIALGYTMVYGVLRFINFAHSDVFMIGAFAGYYISNGIPGVSGGLPRESFLWGTFVMGGSMIICAFFGILIERFAYRPLRSRSRLNVLITAIGVSLFLEHTGQRVFGAAPKSFPSLFPSTAVPLPGGMVVSSTQLAVLGITLFLLVLLHSSSRKRALEPPCGRSRSTRLPPRWSASTTTW
jgi:branched-chain amino acid transport system permease protein